MRLFRQIYRFANNVIFAVVKFSDHAGILVRLGIKIYLVANCNGVGCSDPIHAKFAFYTAVNHITIGRLHLVPASG